MRYLLLLLLSFPAHASVWQIHGEFPDLPQRTRPLTGWFADDLSDWNIWAAGLPFFPYTEPEYGLPTYRAYEVSPTHLLFTKEYSPTSSYALNIFLDKPLGQPQAIRGELIDYSSSYSFTGSVIPEPSTSQILGILLMSLLSRALAARRSR